MLSRNLTCAVKRSKLGQGGAGPSSPTVKRAARASQENKKLFTATTASRFAAMSKRRALPFSWENRDNMKTPGVTWIQDPAEIDLADMFIVLWDGIGQESQREYEIAG